jgi:hypothetical protein
MEKQTSQQITTFTIEQCKQLIKEGLKISHSLWNPDEFICRNWRDGFYQNENGTLIIASKFWNHRFEDGYVIWKEIDEDDYIDSED